MAMVSLQGREDREGHGDVPRAAAPSLPRSFPRPPTSWSSSSSSSSSSRPPSSCSRWRRAAIAWQAALHLRVHASCPDLLHVLAAVDEAAPPVIVLRVCDSLHVTLGLSLCGWPWVGPSAYAAWSESKSEWSVTFYEKSSIIEARLHGSRRRTERVRLHEDQADLWRKQVVCQKARKESIGPGLMR